MSNAAAVAGAPVTEWRLYDTAYTERYLGDPRTEPEVYAKSNALSDTAKIGDPLLIVHGLADDNVVFDNVELTNNRIDRISGGVRFIVAHVMFSGGVDVNLLDPQTTIVQAGLRAGVSF